MDAATFWSKVDKSGECWLWLGARHSKGYGSVRLHGESTTTQRAAWFFTFGVMPTEYVLHTCDNPPCVNPAHLFEGTPLDNTHDAMAKGRLIPPPDGARGERHHTAKLTEADVRAIRTAAEDGEPPVALARRYGVHPRTIRQACKRRTWKAVV